MRISEIVPIDIEDSEHGSERINFKIVRKFNVPMKSITSINRKKPKSHISGIIIGRKVTKKEILEFISNIAHLI